MKAIFNQVSIVILLLLAVPLAVNALSYFNFDTTYGFLKLKQTAIASGWYLPFYYLHVLSSGIILVAGILQIHKRIGLHYATLHKRLGYVYVFGILFISAPGSLGMSFFIDRGYWVFVSFITQAILWFCFTCLAIIAIKRGDIAAHRKWMWRSLALTLAAITLRVYIFATSWFINLSTENTYAIIAWLSWVINLIICEWIIYLNNKSKIVSPFYQPK